MFAATWFNKAEIAGILKLTRNPFYYGLGHYTDINGKVWDISAVMGDHVCARPVDDSGYYSTAIGATSAGLHRWLPYKVELVTL